MKLSITAWSFPHCDLKETVALTKALGIEAMDLGDLTNFFKAALNKSELLKDPKGYAGRLKKDLDIFVPCFYHLFGNGLGDRNLASDEDFAKNLADFKQVLIFCEEYGIPTIFVLPGVINGKQTREDALAVSAKNLNTLTQEAVKHGITLTIEPHVHSYLESPSLTLKLLSQVPNLKLTLDYTHFVCLGFTQEDIDPLAKHAGHVHLRQAKMGYLQTKMEQGTVNFPAMLSTLEQAGFTGYAALEAVHQDYMGTLYEDVVSETVKMRDTFNTWNQN